MADNDQFDETVPDRRTIERRQYDRRESDRPDPPSQFKFTFDHFKWIVSMLIAVVVLYVTFERRSTSQDMSTAYLDKKVDEIKAQNKEASAQISTRLDGLQASVQAVAAANSGMQATVSGVKEDLSDLKRDYKEADQMLEARIISLERKVR